MKIDTFELTKEDQDRLNSGKDVTFYGENGCIKLVPAKEERADWSCNAHKMRLDG